MNEVQNHENAVKTDLKENLYLAILRELQSTTNLQNIQDKFSLSKQNLGYYLRQLRNDGMILKVGKGQYEVVKTSKNSTKYGNNLPQDISRGHANVWTVKLPKEIKDWDKRISLLESRGINFKLVGALKDTPRIKVLGRKVWLCKNHIRIFDKDKASFYGDNAIEAKRKALMALFETICGLESKLGLVFKPLNFEWNKEHYALIKNDLAIEHNKKGEVLRISDESGEWLLIDDSLGEGGELETVGKEAFGNNIKLQKWWNEQKETKFEVTPKFILESIGGVTQNQEMFAENIKTHMRVLNNISDAIDELRKEVKKLRESNKENSDLRNWLKGG
jgi:DNA-binding transcriptional ArsR family regulator